MVLAIIAVVIALLLPAIQKVRTSAQRINCSNNLRQIGLGLLSFHNVEQSFPAGIQDNLEAPYAYLSWMGRILPYVEQEGLWNQTEAAFRADPMLTKNAAHVGELTPVKLYQCSASSVAFVDVLKVGVTVALGSYRGVNGTSMLAGDGVLFHGSAVRVTDVTDGTSDTLIVGESPPFNDLRVCPIRGHSSCAAAYNWVCEPHNTQAT